SSFPGRFILIKSQHAFASSHETRQPEFLISEEELEVVLTTFWLLVLVVAGIEAASGVMDRSTPEQVDLKAPVALVPQQVYLQRNCGPRISGC
ncbi:hypothetical protein EK904_011790, partial [Melospiza melodia maxima]